MQRNQAGDGIPLSMHTENQMTAGTEERDYMAVSTFAVLKELVRGAVLHCAAPTRRTSAGLTAQKLNTT